MKDFFILNITSKTFEREEIFEDEQNRMTKKTCITNKYEIKRNNEVVIRTVKKTKLRYFYLERESRFSVSCGEQNLVHQIIYLVCYRLA